MEGWSPVSTATAHPRVSLKRGNGQNLNTPQSGGTCSTEYWWWWKGAKPQKVGVSATSSGKSQAERTVDALASHTSHGQFPLPP